MANGTSFRTPSISTTSGLWCDATGGDPVGRRDRAPRRFRQRSKPPRCARWPIAGRSRERCSTVRWPSTTPSTSGRADQGHQIGSCRPRPNPCRARPRSPATCLPRISPPFAKADGAGIVLGARVPIVLTSRADSARSRMASAAVAALWPMPPAQRADSRSVNAMNTILVVNAGSSSVKFQVFDVQGEAACSVWSRVRCDGIGSRPRLRASGPDDGRCRPRLCDRGRVADMPAAMRWGGVAAR